MKSETIGFALCGSFCTYEPVLAALKRLSGEYETVVPILSYTSAETDSRFGKAAEFRSRIECICHRPAIDTIAGAEPIGPKRMMDLLVIAPCTGNTLAKLAAGIADTPVTLACKAHLRNGRPVVVAVSTNDGLAGNAKSIGQLLDRKHFYFVPFGQDSPINKPASLVADMAAIPETVAAALEGRQLQPMLLRD